MKKMLKIGFILSLFLLQACPLESDPCEYNHEFTFDFTIGMKDEFTIMPLKKEYKVGEQVRVTLIIKANKAQKVDKTSLNIKKFDFSKAKPTDEVVDIYPIIGDFVLHQYPYPPYYVQTESFRDFLFRDFEDTVKLQQKSGYHQDKRQYIYDAIITLDASRTFKYNFKQGEIYFGKTLREVDCHRDQHTHIINLPKAIEFEVVE